MIFFLFLGQCAKIKIAQGEQQEEQEAIQNLQTEIRQPQPLQLPKGATKEAFSERWQVRTTRDGFWTNPKKLKLGFFFGEHLELPHNFLGKKLLFRFLYSKRQFWSVSLGYISTFLEDFFKLKFTTIKLKLFENWSTMAKNKEFWRNQFGCPKYLVLHTTQNTNTSLLRRSHVMLATKQAPVLWQLAESEFNL